MIEKFNLISAGISLDVDLKNDLNIYETNDKGLVIKYFNEESRGISWVSTGQSHSLLEDGIHIKGFPTVDLQKITAIYPRNHNNFHAPKNAVIYDSEGKQVLQLCIKDLASPMAIERKKRVDYNLIETAYFKEVFWVYDDMGKKVLGVTIDFDWEWWETRVLNPNTGLLGEVLNSGRR